MTNREFYVTIASNTDMNEELRAHAAAALDKMVAANEKRKNTASKKAQENAPLVERIINEILTNEPMTATDVAAVLECSVQKATHLCKAAVAQGHAVQTEVKIPKKGVNKAYTRV